MSEFAIGQRYLSDGESNLGLGIVVEVDTRSVTVLFPQSEQTRVYAKSAMALSRVKFAIGDTITDTEGAVYEVAALEEVSGAIRYHTTCQKALMETRLSAHLSLDKPLERLLAGQVAPHSAYELRSDAQRLVNFVSKHPLRGLMGARVVPLCHQLYIAYEVGKRLAPRVLLADEVGLGKTIQAGLILHHQLITAKATRVLVLVPDSLQYQWMIELKRRFNLDFASFDLVRTAAIKEHNPEQNVFLTEQCIIASIDLLLDHHDLYEQALNAQFDLLVIDEAHHLHWDSTQGGNDKYELVETLSGAIKGLLLLTATPEQLGIESHFARLRLLDKNRFGDLDEFIAEQDDFALVAQMATTLIDNVALTPKQITALEGLLGYDNQLSAINDDDKLRQQIINELLDRHGTGRVLFRNTRDSVQGFLGRRHIAYPLPLPTSWVGSHQTQGKLKEQLWGEENCPDGAWLENDPRVPWLIELLKGELKFEKVLLIARSGATVQSLELALRLHAGVKTAVFSEEMSLLERDQAAAFFADGSGAQILLCSEIGSEGRNFQFAHHLVLFDLPANPDTLEQRIGRLDRIGQTKTITLHVPFVVGTAQERLYHWYQYGLGMFDGISPTAQTVHERFIGELKPLLTSDDSKALATLIADADSERQTLETALAAGRDRLLEYNSCRPTIAKKILAATYELDKSPLLKLFFERFFDVLNIDYSVQKDGRWVVPPLDGGQISDELVNFLPLIDEGLSFSFERDYVLGHDDVAFMTHEHPLTQAIYEALSLGNFGNTAMATLATNSLPEGLLLLEVNFAIDLVAPPALNLAAFLPSSHLRVLLTQHGEDMTEVASSDKLTPLLGYVEPAKAAQVVKLRAELITDVYKKAVGNASERLQVIAQSAKGGFAGYYDKEIKRLTELAKLNPNIRQAEIDDLHTLKAKGLHALTHLKLDADSIRVLITIRP